MRPLANAAYAANGDIPSGEFVRFDERENWTSTERICVVLCGQPRLATVAVNAIPSKDSLFPPLESGDIAGWMYLNLHDGRFAREIQSTLKAGQSWVVLQHQAEGRYSVASSAVPLGNGCSPLAFSGRTNPIGPRP